jgi:transposase
MRTVVLDVHKRFAEVAVHERGVVRRLGRIETRELAAFAGSLGPDDHVVVESMAVTWAIAELFARHAGRVTVSNPMRTKAIASAKVKTDKVEAKVLAQLGAADFLPAVWAPDPETRALGRRVSHRAGLVRQRTRVRNQVHAVLVWNLLEVPVSDLFGLGGRRWLAEVALPAHEREQVESNLRLHDALEGEVKLVDRQLAKRALQDTDVRRLMTIPGVGPITALSLVAVIGEVGRFPSSQQLVGYFGLDPRVRQSGDRPAWTGHISRAGQAHARGLLIEAAHQAARTPGPLRAFHARLKARRGSQIAACATARKLAVLSWQILTKNEDYRYNAPTLLQAKLRRLQLQAGEDGPTISLAGAPKRRELERRLLEEAERNYRAQIANEKRRGRPTGEATLTGPRRANDARQAQ